MPVYPYALDNILRRKGHENNNRKNVYERYKLRRTLYLSTFVFLVFVFGKQLFKCPTFVLEDNRRLSTSGAAGMTGSNLEVVAPVTADVEFKYTWPIDGFLSQVKASSTSSNGSAFGSSNSIGSSSSASCNANGLDSRPFDININGIQTSWNLSIRFWTGEDGERLANPFVLCLNMLSCKVDKPTVAGVKFRFGVLNKANDDYEIGSPDNKTKELYLENSTEIKSVGYKNMAISEKHMNAHGDIQLVCKLKLVKDDSANHSLPSDLKNLINDEKSADLVVEAGGKEFKVHRNILSARSPVFATLLEENDKKDEAEVPLPPPPPSEPIAEAIPLVKKPSKPKLNKLQIKDLQAETLEELLSYIYTDSSANVDVCTNALLAAADIYKLPGLKSHCEKHLSEIITPVNVAAVLMLADQHSCDGLKDSALNYCKDNHNYIIKDSHWKTIEEEKPGLFEEAVTKVVGDETTVCREHSECIKKKGKRYEIERASSIISSAKHL